MQSYWVRSLHRQSLCCLARRGPACAKRVNGAPSRATAQEDLNVQGSLLQAWLA